MAVSAKQESKAGNRNKASGEAGYTLVETLVALALFLTVLIPLGSIVGRLMIDDNGRKLSDALTLAQQAMLDPPRESGTQTTRERDYLVTREITKSGRLLHVTVSICEQGNTKVLLKLERNILLDP